MDSCASTHGNQNNEYEEIGHRNEDGLVDVSKHCLDVSLDVVDHKKYVSTVASGGSSRERLLGIFRKTVDGDATQKQNSLSTFEMPLDIIVDKCLIQEIMVQYIYVGGSWFVYRAAQSPKLLIRLAQVNPPPLSHLSPEMLLDLNDVATHTPEQWTLLYSNFMKYPLTILDNGSEDDLFSLSVVCTTSPNCFISLKCPLCLDWFKQPVLFPCNHLVFSSCMTDISTVRSKCAL
ncbi:hypothetical protein KIW84_076004 [Lathyrus oleraceus]|uniref:Zinc finger C3HC4 RING-type domain-containing protein n=1 Tax=Pisum sativum TaxID=3888 RepID=A0A9D4VWI9_PEA|nr:hypothetical protein KIW84_076004 [Pisum sativum]